jgi:hypothetical protein
MCSGSQAHDKHARSRVSEARYRLAPILMIAIRAAFLASYPLTISNEARAASAGDNFAVEDG